MNASKLFALATVAVLAAALPACDRTEADHPAGAEESPAAELPFVGVWGATIDQCANLQEVEDAPMIFRADGYDQYETHCDYDSIHQTGEATWTLAGACSVQGSEMKDTMVIRIEGDQMLFLDEKGSVFARHVRCDAMTEEH